MGNTLHTNSDKHADNDIPKKIFTLLDTENRIFTHMELARYNFEKINHEKKKFNTFLDLYYYLNPLILITNDNNNVNNNVHNCRKIYLLYIKDKIDTINTDIEGITKKNWSKMMFTTQHLKEIEILKNIGKKDEMPINTVYIHLIKKMLYAFTVYIHNPILKHILSGLSQCLEKTKNNINMEFMNEYFKAVILVLRNIYINEDVISGKYSIMNLLLFFDSENIDDDIFYDNKLILENQKLNWHNMYMDNDIKKTDREYIEFMNEFIHDKNELDCKTKFLTSCYGCDSSIEITNLQLKFKTFKININENDIKELFKICVFFSVYFKYALKFKGIDNIDVCVKNKFKNDNNILASQRTYFLQEFYFQALFCVYNIKHLLSSSTNLNTIISCIYNFNSFTNNVDDFKQYYLKFTHDNIYNNDMVYFNTEYFVIQEYFRDKKKSNKILNYILMLLNDNNIKLNVYKILQYNNLLNVHKITNENRWEKSILKNLLELIDCSDNVKFIILMLLQRFIYYNKYNINNNVYNMKYYDITSFNYLNLYFTTLKKYILSYNE